VLTCTDRSASRCAYGDVRENDPSSAIAHLWVARGGLARGLSRRVVEGVVEAGSRGRNEDRTISQGRTRYSIIQVIAIVQRENNDQLNARETCFFHWSLGFPFFSYRLTPSRYCNGWL
jgi:hypothetical protein